MNYGNVKWTQSGIESFDEDDFEDEFNDDYLDLVFPSLKESIEFESTQQLELWEREFAKIENISKNVLPGIPYSQREITREILRREFVEDIVPSWDDTH